MAAHNIRPTPRVLHPPLDYNIFLNRVNESDGSAIEFARDFKKFKAAECNVLLALTMTTAVNLCIAVRCSFATIQWLQPQPTVLFYLSFFLFLVSVVSGYIVMFSRLGRGHRAYLHNIPLLEMLHEWALDVTKGRYGRHLEDIYMLSFTGTFALFLFGSTVTHHCALDRPLWPQQNCHPLAGTNALPPYVFAMIAPLIPHIFVRGATRAATVVSWVFNVVLFNASHVWAGAPWVTFLRINTTLVLLMSICYEHERMQLTVFLMKMQCKPSTAAVRRS